MPHIIAVGVLRGPGTAEWWHSPPGEKYWEANQAVITEHGVTTERVFICDEYTGELKAILEDQVRAKVRAYVAKTDEVPAELQTRYAIFDESIVHAVVYGASGDAVEYIYSADAADVVQALDRFDRLLAHAREVIVDAQGGGRLAEQPVEPPATAHTARVA